MDLFPGDLVNVQVLQFCISIALSNYSDLSQPGPPNGGLVREISYLREI